MLFSLSGRLCRVAQGVVKEIAATAGRTAPPVNLAVGIQQRRTLLHHVNVHDENLECQYESLFCNPEIDGWAIRQYMNDLAGMDMVPEPRIIIAALKACRYVDDIALAIRFLESVKDKCGSRAKKIYPYIISEIQSTLDDLGISTPEELCFNKPELWLKSVYADDFFDEKTLVDECC